MRHKKKILGCLIAIILLMAACSKPEPKMSIRSSDGTKYIIVKPNSIDQIHHIEVLNAKGGTLTSNITDGKIMLLGKETNKQVINIPSNKYKPFIMVPTEKEFTEHRYILTLKNKNGKKITKKYIVIYLSDKKDLKKATQVPVEYKNALKKAKIYATSMHMSKKGVYEQLVSNYGEKFSSKAANYAIDRVQADWNNNALEKAKSYQKDQNMSSEAIRDQLTSEYGEKFTQQEADYAVSHLPK